MARVLQSAGYFTSHIGKWALDAPTGQPTNSFDPQVALAETPSVGFPTLQGFDQFSGQNNQYRAHNYYPSWTYKSTLQQALTSGREGAGVRAPLADKQQHARNAQASKAQCGADFANCEWSGDMWTARTGKRP